MLASTIQFTTNPPTPSPTTHKQAAEHGSGNQGALPQNPDSMPPPHTPRHAGAPTTTNRQQQACLLCQHQTNQPPARTNPRDTVGRPAFRESKHPRPAQTQQRSRQNKRPGSHPHTNPILRKEVIQPHLPVRLPCYDFVPITSPTFDRSP